MSDRRARGRALPLVAALAVSAALHLALAGVVRLPAPVTERPSDSPPALIAARLEPAPAPGTRAAPRPVRPPPPAPRSRPAASAATPAAVSPSGADAGSGTPPEPPGPLAAHEAAAPAASEPAAQAHADASEPAPPAGPTPSAAPPEPRTLATLPARGRAGYAIATGSPAMPVGRATYAWEVTDGRYRVELVARTSGLVGLLRPAEARQSSEGEVDERGLRPLRFHLDRGDGRIPESAAFDRARQRVTYGPAGQQKEAPLAGGTQDTLSLMLHLAFAPPVDGRRELWLVTGRALHLQAYSVAGALAIETPAGSFRAVHLRREPSSEGDEGYDLWLAEDRPWLPVRIRWTDRRGRVTEAVLDTLELPAR